ncbi:hypothetical protein HDV05_004433 [Chytridiales sp. JEL 0842]|nr:hypothetical protein HDV05_004433 [Chytridiales sp. JEL 0842]
MVSLNTTQDSFVAVSASTSSTSFASSSSTSAKPKLVRFNAEPNYNDGSTPSGPKSWTESEIAEYIANVFSQQSQGDTFAYMELIAILNQNEAINKQRLDPPALTRWITAFSAAVSNITPALSSLVDAFLAIDWTSMGDDFILAYRHLLENLVSAHAFYVVPVVKKLIESLRSVQVQEDQSQAELSTKFDYIHQALGGILLLIPSGPSFMVPILTENFPHKSEGVQPHVWYVKNVLRIIKYAPVLRNPLWALVIDKAVNIDVEIQTALDDLDEDDYAAVVHHCFDPDATEDEPPNSPSPSPMKTKPSEKGHADVLRFEDLGDISDLDSDDDSDDDLDSEADSDAPPPVIVSDFLEMSGKLDSILNYLMSEIRDLANDTFISEDEKTEFFTSVFLRIFERSILPTHKSRYTQFLWFYSCSLNKGCTEMFLVLLAQKVFDASCPSIIRVSASAYLASFVARAAFLDTESVLYCIRMLNGWALNYVEQYEVDVKQPDVQRYSVFYAVVQALLYMFCFRWRQIVSAADSTVAYGQLPAEMAGFPKIVMSKFAPLRICAKAVVGEFARITHKLDMLYCYALMQRGPVAASDVIPSAKPTAQSSDRGSAYHTNAQLAQQSSGMMEAAECLDAFFPFDPCHLTMSRRRMKGIYTEWQGEDDDRDAADSDIDAISSSLDIMMSSSFDM